MNTLIFFLAGVSIGLVTDKFYHFLVENKKNTEEWEVKEETVAEVTTEVNESKTTETVKKQSIQAENSSSETKERRDDLSQLKGVGPKLVDALSKIGIYNFEQLSGSPVDALLQQLKETGGRFSKPAISSIVERAQFAASK